MKKINLPIAAKDSQKISLSNRHIGTTDFFRPFLNYAIETVAKDKIKANIKTFVQGYPLAGANLGQFTHSVHAFFNPFRTVMTDWVNFIAENECRYYDVDNSTSEYINGTNVNSLVVGKRKSVPLISRTDIFYLFLSNLQRFDPSYYSETRAEMFYIQNNPSTIYDSPINIIKSPLVHAYVANYHNSAAFENYSLQQDILDTSSGEDIVLVPQGSKFDIVGNVHITTDNRTGHIGLFLTPYGRLVYQLMRSIGYKSSFGGFFQDSHEITGNGWTALQADYRRESLDTSHLNVFSALPLMSLYKIFIDWYIPSKFRNNYDVQLQVMSMLQYPFREMHNIDDFHLTRPYPLLQEVILYTSYANDYFTNAFLYPNGSNDGDASDIVLKDITLINSNGETSYNNYVQSLGANDNYFNTPYLNGDAEVPDNWQVGSLTQYALRALRALNNYVRRNQIVGYRSIDRILARWGVKLDYTQTNRSVLIASNSSDFFPETVMSHTDSHSDAVATPESQQALLGGRSSNLIFGTDLHVDFDTNEVGLFIVLSSVYPKVGYVQGIDRMVIHKELTDFYVPEFDSLGVQPILFDELFGDSTHTQTNRSGSIFGYTARYADYKYKQDDLSGDFILPSRNAFLESLHTFRLFNKDNAPTSINNQFLIGNGAEYDRIFAMYTDEYDHLQVASYNDVNVYRHVDSAADVRDITDGSGQYYNTPVGGSHTIR